MNRTLLALVVALLTCSPLANAQEKASGSARCYSVRQTCALTAIPAEAGKVQWWVAIPDDGRHQDLLDFRVLSAPGAWEIRRDLDRANRFLFVEIDDPKTDSVEVVFEFTLRREPVHVDLASGSKAQIDETHRRMLKDALVQDARHMVVTPEISRLATKVCGKEASVAQQARRLLDYVAHVADHYSKDPSKPHCGVGDADDCLTNGGGCCTDLHSLFIALARSRGIPARLQMGYRLLKKNLNKEVDPGYRCWAEYFVPGAGWVPADIVEADATDGLGPTVWFSGLTERRVWLNEGRDFRFAGAAATAPVTTMAIGYAEIDGVPARVRPEGDEPAQMSRRVLCTEVSEGSTKLHSLRNK